jgi:hypothetical protein
MVSKPRWSAKSDGQQKQAGTCSQRKLMRGEKKRYFCKRNKASKVQCWLGHQHHNSPPQPGHIIVQENDCLSARTSGTRRGGTDLCAKSVCSPGSFTTLYRHAGRHCSTGVAFCLENGTVLLGEKWPYLWECEIAGCSGVQAKLHGMT